MNHHRLGFAGATVLTVLAALAGSVPAALAGKAPPPPKVGTWKLLDETGKSVGSFRVTRKKTVVGLKIQVPPSNVEDEGGAQCPGGVVKVTNSEALVINRGVEESNYGRFAGWVVGIASSDGVQALAVDILYNGQKEGAELLMNFTSSPKGEGRKLDLLNYGNGCITYLTIKPA
ncbi:MAG TPA: hypothetical protein VIJ21_08485 [Solirubrobacterales bacterium]